MRIGIIGCGISGLTCGIRLLELGHKVLIVTREECPFIVSDVAGAFWYPFRAEPRNRVLGWAEKSYREFARLSNDSATGVFPVTISHKYENSAPEAWWARSVNSFRKLTSAQLAQPFREGFEYQTYLIESPIYMPYLRARFVKLGGEIQRREIKNIVDLQPDFSVVINCTGVSAGTLVNDAKVFPIRGQILRLERPAGLDRGVWDSNGAFVVCRTNDCIFGGVNADNDWTKTIREEDSETLLTRCVELCPQLANPKVIEARVGIRPGRSAVRVEAEKISSAFTVVHNYGHGGAGYTLSWGCAEDVVGLVSSVTE